MRFHQRRFLLNTNQKLHQARLNQWAVLCKEQSQSGLTVKQWCEQNGYTIHTYNYRKHRLKESYVDSLVPEIVPITSSVPVAAEDVHHPVNSLAPIPVYGSDVLRDSRESHESCNATPISILLDGVNISLDASTSDEMLCRVIRALRHA